jgi:hypothetical protein
LNRLFQHGAGFSRPASRIQRHGPHGEQLDQDAHVAGALAIPGHLVQQARTKHQVTWDPGPVQPDSKEDLLLILQNECPDKTFYDIFTGLTSVDR